MSPTTRPPEPGPAAGRPFPWHAVPSDLSDADLVLAVRSGETAAFDLLLERYERPLVAYLMGIVHERDEALDCAQETFVRVYTHADRYDPSSPFKAWLYRIATNVGIDALRKRRRRRWVGLGDTLFRLDAAEVAGGTAAGASPEPPSGRGDALRSLLGRERRDLVRSAIATLPRRYRTALILRDLQELSYEEISQALGVRIGTVKSRVNRARNLLREKLAAHLGDRKETP